MAFAVFNSISSKLLTPLQEAANVSETLVGWVVPLILIGITIYVMLYGIDVMRGAGGTQYVHELALRVARPILVLNLALVGGMYSSTVVAFFNELRTDLAGAFGAGGKNSYAAIDTAVDMVLDTVYYSFPIADQHISFVPADVSGIVMYLCLALIALGMIFYGVVACANLIIIDASLAVIFGLGPLFVACFAWKATARFFDNWLTAVLEFVLTAALFSMVIGMANGMVMKFALNLKADSEISDFVSVALSMLASAGMLIILINRASIIASKLTGGSGISTVGAAQAAAAGMSAASTAGTIAGKAANAAGYMGGAAAGAAGRTNLGARVMQATQNMRERWGAASTGARNFSNAVQGRSVDASGRTTTGHGVSNAFQIGRNATSSANSGGTGTISGGGRPAPRSNWRD